MVGSQHSAFRTGALGRSFRIFRLFAAWFRCRSQGRCCPNWRDAARVADRNADGVASRQGETLVAGAATKPVGCASNKPGGGTEDAVRVKPSGPRPVQREALVAAEV